MHRGRAFGNFMGFNFGTEGKPIDLRVLYVCEFARLLASVAFEFRKVWVLAGAGPTRGFGADNWSSQSPPRPAQSAQLLGTSELVRSRNHLGAVLLGHLGQDIGVVDHASPLK